jgi:hypothetical protein
VTITGVIANWTHDVGRKHESVWAVNLEICMYVRAFRGITANIYTAASYIHPPLQHIKPHDCEAFAFSCASSFRLAAKIISSLRLCKFACLSLLSALHDFAFGCSSCIGCGCWPSLEERLYRVIKSGCAGLAGVAAARAGVGAARGAGVGIWKDAGACSILVLPSFAANLWVMLTVSKPLPFSPLSIVAATFPPFRCKSHAMSRLLSCGSISATWSICAGLTRGAARFAAARVPGAAAVGLLRYHRTARKVTTINTSTWGTLMLCSAITSARS